MNKEEFKKFCHIEFTKRGFKKIKKGYYLQGPKDILCGIFLQKSNFGEIYYVNYCFHICFSQENIVPSYYDMDIDGGRITVKSKTQKNSDDLPIMTSQIEYEDYSAEELAKYFDKEFEEMILPPIYQGKKYILDNLNKLYFLTLRPKEVMRKLQE